MVPAAQGFPAAVAVSAGLRHNHWRQTACSGNTVIFIPLSIDYLLFSTVMEFEFHFFLSIVTSKIVNYTAA
jgi:hypothetical protein